MRRTRTPVLDVLLALLMIASLAVFIATLVLIAGFFVSTS